VPCWISDVDTEIKAVRGQVEPFVARGAPCLV